jgi:hypothetical protein
MPSSVSIKVFAYKLQRKICIALPKLKQLEWKTRARRLYSIIEKACGEPTKNGELMVCKKLVRIGYLQVSARQLTRDVPGNRVLFFRSLPINVRKWIEALATYDIDTYTPRSWRAKNATACKPSIMNAQYDLALYNETPAFAPFFVEMKLYLEKKCVCLREYVSLTDFNQAKAHFSQKYTQAGDIGIKLLKNDMFCINVNGSAATPNGRACPLLLDDCTKRLCLDQILGAVYRGGRLVAIGSGSDVIAVFLIDRENTLIRHFDKGSYAADILHAHMKDEKEFLWVLKTDVVTDHQNPRVSMHTSRIETTCMYGVQLDDYSKMRSPEILSLAGKITERLCKYINCQKRRQQTPIQDCNIVKRVTECIRAMKKTAQPRGAPPSTESPLLKLPPEKKAERVEVPLLCRNAWILPNRQIVEVADTITRDILTSRMRFYKGLRCNACKPDHPDPVLDETYRCSKVYCQSRFEMSSTSSHYIYRNKHGKYMEEDMNLPLFTDSALSALRLVEHSKIKLGAVTNLLPGTGQ